MIPVERMSLARALDLAARIADPEDGADEVPQGDRREAVDVLRCEVVRLRTIIEGRAVPPTAKEARAHSHTTRGAFVVKLGDGNAHCCARVVTGLQRFEETSQRWWALDASGRPCAWPTTEGGR